MKKLRSHLPYNARSRLGWHFTLPNVFKEQSWWEVFCGYVNVGLIAGGLAALFLLVGCGQSTMIEAITTAPPTLGNFNDAAIVNYAELAKQQWGNKALSNEVMAYGGALSLAGLSAAAVASPSPAAKGMVIGLNGLLAVLGIVRPTDRDAAYNTGTNLLLQAEADYVIAVRQEGFCTVPTDQMTIAGTQLYQKTNAAIIVVNNLITGIIQEGFLNAMQILYQTAPIPAKAALKDAAPCK